MYLIRLSLLKAGRAIAEKPAPVGVGDVNVDSQIYGDDGDRLLLNAKIRLNGVLHPDETGHLDVPSEACRAAEEGLILFADLFSATARVRRTLSSPNPYVFFEPESDSEERLLQSCKGVRAGFRMIPSLLPRVALDDDTLTALGDRTEGVSFIAHAQSSNSVVGQFREYIRCFEAAFDTDKMRMLRGRLSEFLSGADNLGYTEEEVAHWLDDLRHAVVHTRGRSGVVTELDIRPVIQRVEQAAYDVLLNKAEWRTGSTDRRTHWKPHVGTVDRACTAFITRGKEALMAFALIDAHGGFAFNIDERLAVPPPLFGHVPQELRRAGGPLAVFDCEDGDSDSGSHEEP